MLALVPTTAMAESWDPGAPDTTRPSPRAAREPEPTHAPVSTPAPSTTAPSTPSTTPSRGTAVGPSAAAPGSPAVAVANNLDGRLEAVWNDNGVIVHAYQVAPNSGWSAAEPLAATLPSPTTGDPAIQIDHRGRLQVVVDTVAGTYDVAQVMPNSSWNDWQLIGPDLHRPALGPGPGGIIVCPARSVPAGARRATDYGCEQQPGPLTINYGVMLDLVPGRGTLARQDQDLASGDWFSPYGWLLDPLPGSGSYDVVTFTNDLTIPHQAYTAFARSDGMAICARVAPDFTQCALAGTPPGGFPGGRATLTASRNQDGRAEVYALGADGGVWHVYELGAGSWSAWEPMFRPFGAAPLTGGPQVQMNTNGTLELVVAATDGTVWHTFQGAPNSAWGGWYPLGPSGFVGSTAIALASNEDGRLEEFNVKPGPGAKVTHSYQAAPSTGPWSAIIPL